MNIVIVGVGGQGSLLASQILGNLFMNRGLDVKVNEVHGMSQRGGNVVTMVRAGERVASPVVMPGTADVLIALEMLEAARGMYYLKPDGILVASSRMILPLSARKQESAFSVGVIGGVTLDALALAMEAGNERAANVVLLGAVSAQMDFSEEEWETAVRLAVKPKFIDVNLKAFTLGRTAAAL